MLQIYPVDGGPAQIIRPCPLMSISWTPNNNAMGTFGGTYSITLNGTILPDEGSPFKTQSFANVYDPRPTGENVEFSGRLGSILDKQTALKQLFSNKASCHKIEVLSIDGNEPAIIFYPRLSSINFEEGLWFDQCKYSINLEADFLLDKDAKMIDAPSYAKHLYLDQTIPTSANRITVDDYIANYGGLVSDFSENWTLEPTEGANIYTLDIAPRNPRQHSALVTGYRLTRNLSATGKSPIWRSPVEFGSGFPHIQAKGFIRKYLETYDKGALSPSGGYHAPASGQGLFIPNINDSFAQGFIGLSHAAYGGYSHSRSESFDKTAGTYSVSDTWILSSGNSFENYSVSVTDGYVRNVVVNGNIRGLSSQPASGIIYGGSFDNLFLTNTPYKNALDKYNFITVSGQFGIASDIYKRIQNLFEFALNPYPTSVSLSLNEFTGEINYDINFDSRPLSIVSGALAEVITVNDTYPGDVFATIPVLGRSTGPIMQYLGTRTEYRRELSIDLTMESVDITNKNMLNNLLAGRITITTPPPPPNQLRRHIILSKPTLYDPPRSCINDIIKQVSPAYEQGIRKYFMNPPVETWNPKDGKYTLNISWIYELDR